MGSLFEFDNLAVRLKHYVERQQLKPQAFHILERVLLQGEMPRGEVMWVTGLKERGARMILANLTEHGILRSDTPKGAVSLRFPSETVDLLFPRLFAEA